MLFVKAFLGHGRVAVHFKLIRRIQGFDQLFLGYYKPVTGQYFKLCPRVPRKPDGH